MSEEFIDYKTDEDDVYTRRGKQVSLIASVQTGKAAFEKTPKQREVVNLACDPETLYLLVDGGSRSGKTFILTYMVFVRALKYANSRHCILRLRYNHAKNSLCRDTIPKMLRVCFPTIAHLIVENKQDSFYSLPNGSQVWVGGLDDKARVEKILGNEYGTLYFNECSQIDFASMEIALTRLAQKIDGMKDIALYDCNPPSIKHWTYQMWYEHAHPETNLPLTNPQNYKVIKINPVDNKKNISEGYLKLLEEMSPAKKKRFLEGSYSTGAEGALFNITNLHKNRYREDEVPEYNKICIGVDPAAKGKVSSDETGIVGAACGKVNGKTHYFVFLDASIRAKQPADWARRAVEAYEESQANKVIGETNNGGDMVGSTIKSIDPEVSYCGVHASRGKSIRAEPVATLAEQGRLHIVGYLPDLEDEMTSWEPDESKWSPNRMDAMVWAVTWLITQNKLRKPAVRSLRD